MLVSYKWLKELVDVDVLSEELAEKMSTTGIEVEGVSSPAEGLSNIVVGEVVSCEEVPETHLHVCQVNVGEEALRQIVCGAPNVRAGIKVMVALPGARIADNYKIKKGKIRGLESLGMICSLGELGISDSIVPKEFSEGIQILPEEAVPGDSVFPYLDLDDEIIELSITPNRADALSMRGVAYEVAAIYDKSVHFQDFPLLEAQEQAGEQLSVAIETEKAPFYAVRILENVTITPSPQWLQNLLMNAGIRPINNVVDVTNYMLLYFGQPMHAFDLDTFEDNQIVVREARAGEKLVTLDDEERDLETSDLVITVADKPVALAGIMGGSETEISPKSRRVVLEAAVFDGTSIRKTSGRLNLRSESSSRFEKGINLATVTEALDAAASMIADLAGATVKADIVSAGQVDTSDVEVVSTLLDVNRVLGTELTYTDIEDVFRRLGFGLNGNAEKFTVSVPRHRWDIHIEADLYEEIARIYGYDKLPATLPKGDGTAGQLTETQKLRRKVRTVAEGAGLTEVITYALTTPEKAVQFSTNPSNLTELMWPMTVDRSVLRQNMVAGILDTVAYNVARKNKDLALYEIGKVFEQTGNPQEELPIEINSFAFALTGLVSEKDFQTSAVPVDFFYAKGVLEALFDRLGLKVEYTVTQALASMHPGRTAAILLDGQVIGFVGQVHPVTAKDYNIPETYVAEINLTAIEQAIQLAKPFVEITKFPAVTRDIALLLKAEISHKEVVEAIEAAGVKRLTDIKLFDVFSGEKLGLGMKSMAYTLTFQNPEDTLEDEEVARYMEKIQKSLEETIGAEVR
ncbi:phenylalanine--tRNA ligase subunit beta [Streptococcus constellatus]|uniref:Phenylalanine--tRNA ligase beta subunit n=1 Tax=Streptococcus constellatus subsp. constellatus SK53 TaxID=1095730 RepID=A0AAD2SVA2_STRCV|nr:phenylalanine--tRNA ligase subunit beta [Streptococcus constellatus]EID18938.1 phenylalanine--tRNA ligase, beta subunit [Streptococcus constellatus subsp. constellatus SK53]MDP1485104.1 phenylalanine--tRNA ligase subunit beta [Streptococcus constellatus]QQT05746.1 phenylalanine--tRNA ligase subunit beta [Streptococcus constellatus]SUN40297.1 phenylalanyl-tRNA synthetase subunit beta [Streptococcus constellatus]BBD22366.1 phenylalanyl-tRNA synthetase subunit beta [Streptococcus constellatus 